MAFAKVLALLLVASVASSVSGQGGIASCCRKTPGTEIPRELLMTYYVQHRPPCPVKAVVFIATGGVRICSDPSKLWTKTTMAFLDGKNYSVSQRRPF